MTKRRRTSRRTQEPQCKPHHVGSLPFGSYFKTLCCGLSGQLLYSNQCRAHVRLTTEKIVKIGEVTFPKTQVTDISSGTEVLPMMAVIRKDGTHDFGGNNKTTSPKIETTEIKRPRRTVEPKRPRRRN